MAARSWRGGEQKVASASFRKAPAQIRSGPSISAPASASRTAAEFEHVYKSGQRFSEKLFQVTVCDNACGFARLGLSIAARAIGNAVARNRIRRVAREAFRLVQRDLPALDFVVSARSAAREASGAESRKPFALVDNGWGTMRGLIKAIIQTYRWLISPLLGPSCRFYPT